MTKAMNRERVSWSHLSKPAKALLVVFLLVASFGVVYAVAGTNCGGASFASNGVGFPCWKSGNPSPLPKNGTVWFRNDLGQLFMSNGNGHSALLVGPIEGNWTSYAKVYNVTNSALKNPQSISIDSSGLLYVAPASGPTASVYVVSTSGVATKILSSGIYIFGQVSETTSAYGKYQIWPEGTSTQTHEIIVTKSGSVLQNITVTARSSNDIVWEVAISADGQYIGVVTGGSSSVGLVQLWKGVGTP